MGNEIVKASDLNLDELQRMAKMLAMSGYFDASQDATVAIAQMATKILAGRELGYGPFASVQGIHVIKGKPALSANLMAAAVKAHPRYDYRVRKMDNDEVSIEFFEDKQTLGISSFTKADALAAQTQNLGKFPRNMLFARAMSNGVRWYCPDVFYGNAVYTPEELGARVDDETGEIIEQPKVFRVVSPEVSQKPTPSNTEPGQAPQGPQQEVNFYPDGEQLFSRDTEPAPPRASREQQNQFHAIGTKIYGAGPAWDAARHKLVEEITTGATTSSNDLTPGECNELMLTMLGKAAFGDEWSAKAEALCKAANVVSLRQLPPATVKTSLTKLQKQLEDAPVVVGK